MNKNSRAPSKFPLWPIYTKEDVRSHSRLRRFVMEGDGAGVGRSPSHTGGNVQISLISNLRSELGNIKSEVTKLMEKYPIQSKTPYHASKKILTEKQQTGDEPSPKDSLNRTEKKKVDLHLTRNPEEVEESLFKKESEVKKLRRDLEEAIKREAQLIEQKGDLMSEIAELKKVRNSLEIQNDHIEDLRNQAVEKYERILQKVSSQYDREKLEYIEKIEQRDRENGKLTAMLKKISKEELDRYDKEKKLELLNERLAAELKVKDEQIKKNEKKVADITARSDEEIMMLKLEVKELLGIISNLEEASQKKLTQDHTQLELKQLKKQNQTLSSEKKKLERELNTTHHSKPYCASLEATIQALNSEVMKMKLQTMGDKYI